MTMAAITIYDELGLVGVVVTIIGYFFLQSGKIQLRGWLYSFLNALGSLLILVSLCAKFNLAAFVMEAIWFFISIYGFYKVHQELKQTG